LIFGGNSPFSLEGNFARTFDIGVLGLNHIPQFFGIKFDQTGLLSTLPSIVNVLLGYLAGRLIDTTENKWSSVKKLIIYGLAGIALGIAWNIIFPINKPLWTSSFVLYTCGFASVLLGILLWLIDIKEYTSWAVPFNVFGLNPIFIYSFSEFMAISFWIKIVHSPYGEPVSITNWVYNSCFLPLAGDINGSLLYALCFALICWVLGWLLLRNRIFIKI